MRPTRGGINTGRCDGATDQENKNAGLSPLFIKKGLETRQAGTDREKER